MGVAGLNWLSSNGLDNEALQIQQTVRPPSAGQFLKSTDRVPFIETTDALGIQDPTMPSNFLSENYSLSKLPSCEPPSAEIRSVTLTRTIDTVTLTAEPIDELFQMSVTLLPLRGDIVRYRLPGHVLINRRRTDISQITIH